MHTHSHTHTHRHTHTCIHTLTHTHTHKRTHRVSDGVRWAKQTSHDHRRPGQIMQDRTAAVKLCKETLQEKVPRLWYCFGQNLNSNSKNFNYPTWGKKKGLHPHSEHRFPALSSELCQIWLRHWRGTLYLGAAVHRRGQHPLKGFGTNMTAEAA